MQSEFPIIQHPGEPRLVGWFRDPGMQLLVTGPPRSGKTTFVRRAASTAGIHLLEFAWGGMTDSREVGASVGYDIARSVATWKDCDLGQQILRLAADSGIVLQQDPNSVTSPFLSSSNSAVESISPLLRFSQSIESIPNIRDRVALHFENSADLATGRDKASIHGRLRAEFQLMANLRRVFSDRLGTHLEDPYWGGDAPFARQMIQWTCDPIPEDRLNVWMGDCLAPQKINLDSSAARRLLELSYGVLGELAAMLAHIRAHAGAGITLSGPDITQHIFAMVEARRPLLELILWRYSPDHRAALKAIAEFEPDESRARLQLRSKDLAARYGYSGALSLFERDRLTYWDADYGLRIADPIFRFFLRRVWRGNDLGSSACRFIESERSAQNEGPISGNAPDLIVSMDDAFDNPINDFNDTDGNPRKGTTS